MACLAYQYQLPKTRVQLEWPERHNNLCGKESFHLPRRGNSGLITIPIPSWTYACQCMPQCQTLQWQYYYHTAVVAKTQPLKIVIGQQLVWNQRLKNSIFFNNKNRVSLQQEPGISPITGSIQLRTPSYQSKFWSNSS